MKKLATLFTSSYQELKQARTITACAMFMAIAVVLRYFSLEVGNYIRISFSSVAAQFVYYLFGPVVGGMFGGAMDLLKYLIKPTGGFFPGFTIGAMIAGVLYGAVFYKRPLTLRRVLAAELLVAVVCNMLLGTLWLSMLYGKGFFVLLPMRIVKNLVMWPINSVMFYTLARTMEISGVFRLIRAGGSRKRPAGL